MSVYFVSRHPGARDWSAQEGIAVDDVIAHFDVAQMRAGDVVIGSLPVNLTAESAHAARVICTCHWTCRPRRVVLG